MNCPVGRAAFAITFATVSEKAVAGIESADVPVKVIVAVSGHVVRDEAKRSDRELLAVAQRHIWAQHGVSGEPSVRECQRLLVTVHMIGVTVRVDDIGDRKVLRSRTFDEDVRRVRRIDQHRLAGRTITKQVPEVAIAAGSNLFENEWHAEPV